MATFCITLHVDTSIITKDNIETTCRFTQTVAGAETGQPDTLEDFTTEVQVGDTVIWNGFCTPGSLLLDTVDIVRITDTGGPNVFTNLTPSSTARGTVVTGLVEPSLTDPRSVDEETYLIDFVVYNYLGEKLNLRGVYRIDPIIKVKPSGK